MLGFQRPKLAVLTVLFLLSFTALDLIWDTFAYPFCSSDLEHGSEASGTPELANNDESEGSIPSDVHIDDCFCCSRCVDNSASFVFLPRVQDVVMDSAPTVSFSLLLPDELYRPPRFS